MSWSAWPGLWIPRWRRSTPCQATGRAPVQLGVEILEERCLLATYLPGAGPYWDVRNLENLAAQAAAPKVVFLGDSILDYYVRGPGAFAWNTDLAPLGAQDFAIAGNTTKEVSRQLAAGELSRIAPRVVVLGIGSNDFLFGGAPDQVASAIAGLVSEIHFLQPQASILLLGILPRGPNPTDLLRQDITQTNNLLAGLADGKVVTFLDVGGDFLQPDGTISLSVLYDYTHPTSLGYAILTAAIEPTLLQMLGLPNGFEVPVVGDWDGSGQDQPGSFNPITATWTLHSSSGGPDRVFQFGLPGDVPVVGDWTGSGQDTVGVFDPLTATWFLRASNSAGAADVSFQFGQPGDLPVVGDWDGSGQDSVGVYDPLSGNWLLAPKSEQGFLALPFGASGYLPVVGDWNGSGRDSIGIFDPVTAIWYLLDINDATSPVSAFQYGQPGWAPVAGHWQGQDASTVGGYDYFSATWYLRSVNGPGPADFSFLFGTPT